MMRMVALQGTGLATSRLGFGTSGLHHLMRSRTRQRLLAQAFDLGIRHFDTAPYYGHTLAERELGVFSATRRGQLVLATKFGIEPDPLLSRLPLLMYARLAASSVARKLARRAAFSIVPARNYSAEHARASLETSLRALRTDHVDIFFLHEPSLLLLPDAGELAKTLEQLQQAGKVRCVGLAGNAHDCLEVARRYPSLADVLQIDAGENGSGAARLQATGRSCHVSFGHFRGKSTPTSSLLARAVQDNPSGVILFSTRRAEHLGEIVNELTKLENP